MRQGSRASWASLAFPTLGIISQLLLDTAYSWVRMAFALLLSILFSWAVGIAAARNRKAERIILPVLDVLKSIPADYIDLANLERLSFWKRLKELYIPSTWARVAYNSKTSWSVGLFYLVTSEIFSLGSSFYSVSHGIGVD